MTQKTSEPNTGRTNNGVIGLTFVALLIGLLASFMSLWTHVTVKNQGQKAACDLSDLISCSSVVNSGWSEFLGIPLASYGLAFYLTLILTFFLVDRDRYKALVYVLGILAAISSIVLFSISLFAIKKICLWCLANYFATFLLLTAGYLLNRKRSFQSIFKSLLTLVTPEVFPSVCGVVIFAVLVFAGSKPLLQLLLAPSLSERQQMLNALKEEGVLDDLKIQGKSKLTIDDSDYSLGPKDAKVEIVEFADYQCPPCQYSFQLFKKLVEEYKPHVRLIFKNFPLDDSCNSEVTSSFHIYACEAAELARCAGEQGKFFEVSSIMTTNGFFPDATRNLAPISNSALDLLKSKINDNEVSIPKLTECLTSKRSLAKIKSDIDQAIELGLTGTPGLFINSYKIQHLNEAELRKYIEAFIKVG